MNESRKQRLTMELMPQLDEQVVGVARKRKTCPSQCARHLAKQCKHECLRMVSNKSTQVQALHLHSTDSERAETGARRILVNCTLILRKEIVSHISKLFWSSFL